MGDETPRGSVETPQPPPTPKSRVPSRAKLAGGAGAAAVVAAGAAVGATALVRSRQTPNIPNGSILVNGDMHRVQSAPDTPLLYVLRDELGLRGPKFGCGLAQCGACGVLVGDSETRSCVTVWTGVKDEITTLEGLGSRWAKQKGMSGEQAAKALHPVQQAWIAEQVPQCGYCQNGMMIMAVDLLTRNSNPTEAQIRDAFTNTGPSPHLCRCGTYQSIIRATQHAARLM